MMIFTRFNLQLNSISSRNSFQERRFLLVTGLGYQLLGVILETGGCTAEASDIVKPDPFYVENISFLRILRITPIANLTKMSSLKSIHSDVNSH